MSELELYTAEIFQVSHKSQSNDEANDNNSHYPETFKGYKSMKDLPNMTSARVIKGKIIELEHSKLVGPTVKFKTVINYSQSLEPGATLGVVLKPQDNYIAKSDNDD